MTVSRICRTPHPLRAQMPKFACGVRSLLSTLMSIALGVSGFWGFRNRGVPLTRRFTLTTVQTVKNMHYYHGPSLCLHCDTRTETITKNKTGFLSKANHPRMCASSYWWSLPVTWKRWRSHHSIRRNRKPHATYNFMALCIQDVQLPQRDRTAGCVIVSAKVEDWYWETIFYEHSGLSSTTAM